MNAEELDLKFDDGEDVLEHFDISSLQRPGLEARSVEVSFPQWMLAALDREAQRLGIDRDAVIKMWLSERLQGSTATPAR